MAILSGILNVLLTITSLFLICLILIQRGKGGGLAGAFGGMGGSSAFGAKAGDVFTRVTIYVALVWGFLAMVLVFHSNRGTESAWGNDAAASMTKSIEDKAGSGKGKAKSSNTAAPESGSTKAPASSPSPASSSTSLPAIPDEVPPAKAK